MKNKFFIYILASVFFLIFAESIQAQSFGFGCLGLSGFYGGYTQQQYVAEGIDDYVQLNNSGTQIDPSIKFKEGTGFRIGANLFRAQWDPVFITLKGFYQFMKEGHHTNGNINDVNSDIPSGVLKKDYQLTMNYWGVGLDFGIPLFSIIDWKIVEGGVTFFNTEFSNTLFLNEIQQYQINLSPEKTKIGYYVGSGLIFHIIRDYISLEGTAAYSMFNFDKLTNNNGDIIPVGNSTKKAIEKGGFTATVQLNIGFPL